jgi:uncharacterized membrane protein YfcA
MKTSGQVTPQWRFTAAQRASSNGLATVLMAALLLAAVMPVQAQVGGSTAAATPWWFWSIALFVACFAMGVVAVPAGIGGGTLFVPIVGSLFPFHLDFVRGAGTLVALTGALAAGPTLLRAGLADLRLSLPLALTATVGAIIGARIGLALPPAAVQLALGLIVLAIAALMLHTQVAEFPIVDRPDALSLRLGLGGRFRDRATGQAIDWQVRRTPLALLAFLGIGLLGGIFGIGAGWANLPVLNLLMGAPLKIAAGSSGLILSLSGSSAAWIYLHRGAVLPLIAAPSILGMMLGAHIGAHLLQTLPAQTVRRLVVGVMIFAGGRALLAGSGVWT